MTDNWFVKIPAYLCIIFGSMGFVALWLGLAFSGGIGDINSEVILTLIISIGLIILGIYLLKKR